MIELNDKTILHAPSLSSFEKAGVTFFIDPEAPHWIATDERGAFLIRQVDGRRALAEISQAYATRFGTEQAKAWLHTRTFLRNALRQKFLASQPFVRSPYTGRADYLRPERLNEFWFHTNNRCNLTCTHCLVNSSPKAEGGLPLETLKKMIDEAAGLGVHRFYFTGGEPFLRSDIFDLIRYVTETRGAELIILTNATLFVGEKLTQLSAVDRAKVKLQVSIDGTRAEINDAIRGQGTFRQVCENFKKVAELGFHLSLTSVATNENIQDLRRLPNLAKEIGARSIHLMWAHRRGRILESVQVTSSPLVGEDRGGGAITTPIPPFPHQGGRSSGSPFPTDTDLLRLARDVKALCNELGIQLDNYESVKGHVNSQPGVKFDLGNACWDSLCLYCDGKLYPSAALANHKPLSLGDALKEGISKLWRESPVAEAFRSATVQRKARAKDDVFKFITGGGDLEHTYFYAAPHPAPSPLGRGEGEGSDGALLNRLLGPDPYYGLYVGLIQDVMFDLASKKRSAFNARSGFSAPVIYHAMGEGGVVCGIEKEAVLPEDQVVTTLHSNCVLAFDVEKPRKVVQAFYGKAAEEPQKELCCPVQYDDEEIAHIPKEVLDRFYGCGSPMSMAQIREGETVLDLGSGGGIDCFIAAKKVGPTGKVVGIDMTNQMLEVANRNKGPVAETLGYDVVEFKKGYLEKIPLPDRAVNLITSNCVINLSPDKKEVFREMWRVLADHGRVVVSDIVCDESVPPSMRVNERLWGECLSGALTEEEFLGFLEEAGFYGLEVLRKTYWKTVHGYAFHSVTVRGFKYEKKAGCVFIGQKAIYRGPFKSAMDEEGHLFLRNEPMEICTDTAAKLLKAPYTQHFTVLSPEGEVIESDSEEAQEMLKLAAKNACCPSGDGGCC